MKYQLIGILFLIFTLSSCTTEPEQTYDNFDFYIDSITNITSSTATVTATLTMHKIGTVNISGLFLDIGRTTILTYDSLYRELDFDKIDKVVQLTITGLMPNTLYYIQPMGRFNPPFNKWTGRVTGFGSPSSMVSFTTLAKDSIH